MKYLSTANSLITRIIAASVILLLASCSQQQPPEKANTQKASASSKAIGVQVYSVRDALKRDFEGTLKKLSELGYKHIEAYGLATNGTVLGMSASQYRQAVEKLGMSVISVHADYFTPEQAAPIITAAKELGVKYLVIPYLQKALRKDYDAVAENLNSVGALFKGTGIRLAYHNHDFEFEALANGRIPLEVLIEGTQPELVTFQADLYWVTKAGADPMALIKKYPGRFSLFHIKDANEALEQTTVGTGIVDFETILKAKSISGNEYFFVEDERTNDPFGNLKGAFNYLNNADFVK